MDTNMEVNFSNTNPVAEILRLQPPSWLVLTQSGISINLSSGEVIIPENLELSVVSREFWNSVDNLAKTRISELEAQLAAEKFTSEQLQKTIDSMAATEAKHAAEMSRCLKGMDEANEKLRERLTARGAKLKAAREALEIARQETRIAAVMLDQVEPSAAITVKESDRLHLAANKMRTVSDLSDKALAALDGEV